MTVDIDLAETDETHAPEPGEGFQGDARSSVELAIWAWFNECMPNSPVARDAAAWNHLRASIRDLAGRVEKVQDKAYVENAVFQWCNQTMPGSACSRSIEVWEHLFATIPALIKRLQGLKE
jgi:hypothetical protein